MYTPGKGGVVTAVAGTGAGVLAVTELPKTGASLVNEIAIAAAITLVVWAVVYKIMQRRAA